IVEPDGDDAVAVPVAGDRQPGGGGAGEGEGDVVRAGRVAVAQVEGARRRVEQADRVEAVAVPNADDRLPAGARRAEDEAEIGIAVSVGVAQIERGGRSHVAAWGVGTLPIPVSGDGHVDASVVRNLRGYTVVMERGFSGTSENHPPDAVGTWKDGNGCRARGNSVGHHL